MEYVNDTLPSVITALTTIIVAIITAVYGPRVVAKMKLQRPKDRIEGMFDGYERLIAQLQADIDRKSKMVTTLESVVDRLEEDLKTTKQVLADTRVELAESQRQNGVLTKQLNKMRDDYKKTK